MSRWADATVSLSLALGLGSTLPAAHGAAMDPPRVNLGALRVTPQGVTAPVVGGGTAELTLDASLQRAAIRLLAQAHPRTGALVAVDPGTGHVLAWAGIRGAVPTSSVVEESSAPAASLFKIITATALLEKHVHPDRNVCVAGGGSWITLEHLSRPRTGHALCGPFKDALGRSRNAVFAQLAARFLHRDDLLGTADRFGFGQNVPFDFPVPTGSLEVAEGDLPLARTAAGFQGSRLTPLGAAHVATTVATGGSIERLRVVQTAEGFAAPPRRELLARAMHESTARELVRMMEVTVGSGTSREAFTDADGQSYLGDIRAAGKTGTLQPVKDEPTTSWFVGFAPSRRPRIVISVLLENGQGWRKRANEVGRDVLRAYFAARGARGVTAPEGL